MQNMIQHRGNNEKITIEDNNNTFSTEVCLGAPSHTYVSIAF